MEQNKHVLRGSTVHDIPTAHLHIPHHMAYS